MQFCKSKIFHFYLYFITIKFKDFMFIGHLYFFSFI